MTHRFIALLPKCLETGHFSPPGLCVTLRVRSLSNIRHPGLASLASWKHIIGEITGTCQAMEFAARQQWDGSVAGIRLLKKWGQVGRLNI